MRRPHEDDERARSGVRARVRGLLVSLYLRVCVRQAATLSSDTRTTSQNKNTAATMSSVMVVAVLRPRSVWFHQDGQPVQCPSLSWESNWCADTNGNTKVEQFFFFSLIVFFYLLFSLSVVGSLKLPRDN